MSNYVYARSHGLGAVTRNGFTVEYYADPATLDFKDRNMKKLYENLRNADVDFQKMMNDIARSLRPAIGTVEFISGGGIKAADIEKAFRAKLPTSGMAVFLEVACGARPLDQGFQAVGQMLKRDLEGAVGAFGLLGGVSAAVSASSLIPSPVQPFLLAAAVPLVALASIAIPAAFLCGGVAMLLGNMITGELPSKKDFGDSLKAAARLAGSPEPSQAEIDSAYKGLKDANDVAKALKQATTSDSPAPVTARDRAIAAAKAAARAQIEARVKALKDRGARDARTGSYNPPAPTPPPDFDTATYQAGWQTVKPLPSGVPPQDVTPRVPVKINAQGEPVAAGFPVVPVALAAGLALLLLSRR